MFFTPQTDAARIAALTIAVCSFCILDLAINTTMWPSKLIIPSNMYSHFKSDQYHAPCLVGNQSLY